MAWLPPFTAEGLLPPGEYVLTLEELAQSQLVLGPDPDSLPSWASDWRRRLVDNLAILIGHLRQVGLTEIFVDGSFVEEKDVPNDLDGYFVCAPDAWAAGDIQERLLQLDPIWTWEWENREPFRAYPKPQLPMWHKYRVELFPDFGQFCGIVDGTGRALTFGDAFRLSRSFTPKGIVKIGGL